MLTMRTEAKDSTPKTNPNPESIQRTPKASLYEQCREERIKENLQRMQNLGILNLSLKLKSETRPVKRRYCNPNSAQNSTPLLQPSRRSSRLENSTPVIYTDGINVKGGKASKQGSVVVREGPRPEIYTEEDEKLLGNTERSWTCFVDGYDKDGKRIYDPFNGKTCHQCRQKTLGYRTKCSECDMVQGQFCGDCLFMRYGEHVLEALENPNWICPVCRGICNCSLCRNHKGWVPTGPIYRRIAKLGYKSVAHYLIQTKRLQTDDATPNQASAKRSLSFQEVKPLPKIADDEELPKFQNMEDQNDYSLQKEDDGNTNENQNGDLPEEVQKLENIENQNGDSSKKEDNENPNSARRSLSFLLPSVDDQTPLVDAQVLYLEPPKHDKQDHSCAHTGDDLPEIQERSLSFFLPSVDDQTPLVDVQVLYLEPPKHDKQEHSCVHIDDDLPEIQERTGQNLKLDTRPQENQTLVVEAQNKILCDETETRGNSVSTPVTRSKRKVALEPNPDSIGGRLRQRRRSQSGL